MKENIILVEREQDLWAICKWLKQNKIEYQTHYKPNKQPFTYQIKFFSVMVDMRIRYQLGSHLWTYGHVKKGGIKGVTLNGFKLT